MLIILFEYNFSIIFCSSVFNFFITSDRANVDACTPCEAGFDTRNNGSTTAAECQSMYSVYTKNVSPISLILKNIYEYWLRGFKYNYKPQITIAMTNLNLMP